MAFIRYWNGACVLACDFIVTLHQVCFGISFDCSCCNICVLHYVIHIDILYIKSQMSLLLVLYFDF